jgi:hypothetical protein
MGNGGFQKLFHDSTSGFQKNQQELASYFFFLHQSSFIIILNMPGLLFPITTEGGQWK